MRHISRETDNLQICTSLGFSWGRQILRVRKVAARTCRLLQNCAERGLLIAHTHSNKTQHRCWHICLRWRAKSQTFKSILTSCVSHLKHVAQCRSVPPCHEPLWRQLSGQSAGHVAGCPCRLPPQDCPEMMVKTSLGNAGCTSPRY